MQSKIQEDELGPFEFHLFWALFLLVQCLQAFWQEAVQHTRRVAQDVVEEKYQQNPTNQASSSCFYLCFHCLMQGVCSRLTFAQAHHRSGLWLQAFRCFQFAPDILSFLFTMPGVSLKST